MSEKDASGTPVSLMSLAEGGSACISVNLKKINWIRPVKDHLDHMSSHETGLIPAVGMLIFFSIRSV